MKLRALVIDDCRITRRSLMHMLPRTGLAEFEFTEAGDGAEALALFRPEAIDIVFVDWQMPHVDGVEFICVERREPIGGNPLGFLQRHFR